jgi:selenide,water dikinase
MVEGSGAGVRLFSRQVPVIEETYDFAAMGLIPAGAYRNREYRETMLSFDDHVSRALQDILFDPQTSGGLLISVPEHQADALTNALQNAGVEDAAQIGEVIDGPEEKIWIV